MATALGLATLVGGNLVVLRLFSEDTRASFLVGMLALGLPSALLAGFAVGCLRLAATRLAGNEGLAAGSAIKVGLVLALTVGLALMIVGLQITYTPLGALLPSPIAGALFLYRGVVVVPVLGGALVLAAGLMVLEGWRGGLPGAAIAVLAALGFSTAWLDRGAGLAGYELAGASLALPLAALLGAVAQGSLLLTVQRAREDLGMHLARPFDLGDVAALLGASWRTSLALGAAAIGATAWSLLVLRSSPSMGADTGILAVLLVGLGLAFGEDVAARAGAGGGGLRTAVVVLLVLLGAGLLIVPRLILTPVEPHMDGVGTLAARLAGVVLLHEAALRLATDAGLLRHRRAVVVEFAVFGVLTTAALVVMSTSLDGLLPLVVAVLAVRGVTVPLLRF